MAPPIRVLFLALTAAFAAEQKAQTKETPVQKVIQLLDGMIAKGEEEKGKEAVQFSAFKAFCDSTTAAKQKAIKDAAEKVEVLKADIGKYQAEAEKLDQEIAALDTDLTTWEGDLKAATKVRDIENNDYVATHADYTSSIEALEAGVQTLQEQNHDVGQAAALLQLKGMSIISEEAERAIDLFLSQDSSISLTQTASGAVAPEAAAFESHMQGLIDMLTGMVKKFKAERSKLESEEQDSKHAFEMLSMDIKSQLESATSEREAKAEKKGEALQGQANANGDLADTTTTAEDDTKYVTDLVANCEIKSSQFADRQQIRQEEIEAVGKAKEILSSGAVAGASEQHLPQLLQQQATVLLQLRSFDSSEDPANVIRVAKYLDGAASRLNSRVLQLLATRVTADPFKKVKKMIKDLIVKLMEEATSEAETKGFCDKEMGTNTHTRKEKTTQVESLTADIDELESSVATLTEEMAELTTAVAELDAAVQKATAIRTAEKKKNAATIKDAQDAQTAVAQALAVLKEFYAKSAFMQVRALEPEIFGDEPYKGMGGASGGVVGMIEVIQSDFARLESETTAAEEEAAKEYKTLMNDTAVDKMQKSKDLEHKTEKKESQAEALQEKKSDLAGTEKELAAAMDYYEKLKPTCVSGGQESFEDRTAQRKEEIESLQEALRILNGEDIAL